VKAQHEINLLLLALKNGFVSPEGLEKLQSEWSFKKAD
jgi:hypothetical protein